MKAQDFCYWLQGFFELGGERIKGLDEQQIELIRYHLKDAIRSESNNLKLPMYFDKHTHEHTHVDIPIEECFLHNPNGPPCKNCPDPFCSDYELCAKKFMETKTLEHESSYEDTHESSYEDTSDTEPPNFCPLP